MNILVTGGAGFIGSHLSKRLICRNKNDNVVVIDNMSLGNENNLKSIIDNKNFKIYKFDINQLNLLENVFKENNFDIVFHLAANSDIQSSSINPLLDYNNTFATTYNILECMRKFNVKKLVFASTSAVYGYKERCINEDTGPLIPISYYGGAKLASEGFISAYTYMNDMKSYIFRFPNVVGSTLTHGVIFDFINKLKQNTNELIILGDGMQKKVYIYIDDLIDAIMFILDNSEEQFNYYNVSSEGSTTVNKIADIICNEMNLKNVKRIYTGGKVGWKGDVSKFIYDFSKISRVGWKAKYTSDEAVELCVKEVLNI